MMEGEGQGKSGVFGAEVECPVGWWDAAGRWRFYHLYFLPGCSPTKIGRPLGSLLGRAWVVRMVWVRPP